MIAISNDINTNKKKEKKTKRDSFKSISLRLFACGYIENKQNTKHKTQNKTNKTNKTKNLQQKINK